MIRFEDNGRVKLVVLTDAKIVEESRIQRIGDSLNELVSTLSAGQKLVVDLSHVEFMTSAMMGKLVRLHKTAQAARVELRLLNLCPFLTAEFRVNRLDKVLNICDGKRSLGSAATCPVLA